MGRHSGKYDSMVTDEDGEITSDNARFLSIESDFFKKADEEDHKNALETDCR